MSPVALNGHPQPLAKRSEWLRRYNVRTASVVTDENSGTYTLQWRGGRTDGCIKLDEKASVQIKADRLVVRRKWRTLHFKAADAGATLDEWRQSLLLVANSSSSTPRLDETTPVFTPDSSRAPSALHTRAQSSSVAGHHTPIGRNGHGTESYPDGTVYVGEWKDGKRHGSGTYRHADGTVYDGAWQDGTKEGEGSMRWAVGNEYTGEWANGHRQGRGVYKDTSGDTYEGEWWAGKKDGHGICRFANGDTFEGRYKAGRRDGCGMYRYASGMVEVGGYRAGKDAGDGVRWSEDGSRAWRLRDGARQGVVDLEEARLLAELVGVPMPAGPSVFSSVDSDALLFTPTG